MHSTHMDTQTHIHRGTHHNTFTCTHYVTRTRTRTAALYMRAQAASDRGPAYSHEDAGDANGRLLLQFLTDLIYCDMTLLSGIICSIGIHYPSTQAEPQQHSQSNSFSMN